jgi:hypothetical protein
MRSCVGVRSCQWGAWQGDPTPSVPSLRGIRTARACVMRHCRHDPRRAVSRNCARHIATCHLDHVLPSSQQLDSLVGYPAPGQLGRRTLASSKSVYQAACKLITAGWTCYAVHATEPHSRAIRRAYGGSCSPTTRVDIDERAIQLHCLLVDKTQRIYDGRWDPTNI